MTRLRDDLVALDGYHSPQVAVDVRLNTNESPLPPPDGFRAALAAGLAALDWHRYPDRAASDLRAAIGALHAVGGDQVHAGNGSNEVIQALCLAYGGPGRSAAVFEPTYRLHSHIATITGTAVVTGSRRHDLTIDLDEVARVIDVASPAITFLCSPNNPTGIAEAPEVVEAVLERVAAAGGLLVVDEAYGQFAPTSAVDLVGAGVPLAVTRTYSKTWSMAAARLGYVVTGPEVVADLDLVTLPYHLDAAKQLAGRLALDHVDAMHERVALLNEERGRVAAALADLPVDTWTSGANFILFRPTGVDGRVVWQGLLDQSVLIRDCTTWPRLEGCLRVTMGTPEENDRFLTALTEILGRAR